LRNDVKFHKHQLFGKDSTRIVTAYDFEYSFNRLLDSNVASPGRWVLQNVANFKAENRDASMGPGAILFLLSALLYELILLGLGVVPTYRLVVVPGRSAVTT
jgi:hypothetical protein